MPNLTAAITKIENIFSQIESRRPEAYHDIQYLKFLFYLLENSKNPHYLYGQILGQFKVPHSHYVNVNNDSLIGLSFNRLYDEGRENLWIDKLLPFLLYLDSRHRQLFLS